MRVVSNTSPLIFLSKVKLLSLLKNCFEEVFVPQAVRQEFKAPLPHFIKPYALSKNGLEFVKGSLGRLHNGELEAIVAAQELKADFILMDDLLARHKAERLAVKPLGTVGILSLAVQNRFLSSRDAEATLHQLVQKHGLFISKTMFKTILSELRLL